MENNKRIITVLNKLELKDINGGSEATDAFWYGVGWTVGYAISIWEIWTADPHNSRFR